MPKDFPESWQFRSVRKVGAASRVVEAMFSAAPILSERGNVPIGEDLGSVSFPLPITAPYIHLKWSLPSDVSGEFTWTGKLKIVRRQLAFVRDYADIAAGVAELIVDKNYGAGPWTTDEYDEEHEYLDQNVGEPGAIWYYTVFAEDTSGVWCYSPEFSHTRNFALKNETQQEAGDGQIRSKHGRLMWGRLPRALKWLDAEKGADALRRIVEAFGRSFDALVEELEQSLRSYNPDEVDASRLPYIDWLLGWSTNFELDELKRRQETKQIVDLWKTKGTRSALETALQTVTDWDATAHEGFEWIIRASTAPMDAGSPPADWNEPTDGVWADLVNALPAHTTPDSTDPNLGKFPGTINDKLTYTPSVEKILETGTGQWWQNVNGVLIELREIADVSGPLSEVIIDKVLRVAPLFALHYAAFVLALIPLAEEEQFDPLAGDQWDDVLDADGGDESYDPLSADQDAASTPSICTFYTYPDPGVDPAGSVTNDAGIWTPHSYLTYTCGA